MGACSPVRVGRAQGFRPLRVPIIAEYMLALYSDNGHYYCMIGLQGPDTVNSMVFGPKTPLFGPWTLNPKPYIPLEPPLKDPIIWVLGPLGFYSL